MIRALTTLADCLRVVDLEKEVWGYSDGGDVVPAPVLIVTIKRGGVLLGAFDAGGVMQGFVYSIPGWKGRQPIQWSYMLGVSHAARDRGIGRALKLAQREHTLAQGVELVEWTYDPLQALNAHFNFARLGVVVGEYEENIYGESSSPLHRGTPTDRFVAEWRLRDPEVERRIASLPKHDAIAPAEAVLVNPSAGTSERLVPGRFDLALDAPAVLVEIPMGFAEAQARDPGVALAWRMATREIFQTYFKRGYRAVDFFLNREQRRGRYLLRIQSPNPQ